MARNGPCLKTGQIDLFLIQNIQIIEGNKIARNSHRKVNTCFVYAGYTDAHFKFAHNDFDLKVVAKNVMQLMDSKSVFSSDFENKVLKEEGLEQDENNTFTMSNLIAWESR